MRRGILVVSALLSCAAAAAGPADIASSGYTEQDFIFRARRLTFEGRRAGEGYYSADAGKLVFQSEREPGNPFFQIYVLDLQSGETRRVSPGRGKTTCAFFQPGSGRVMFASTHLDPTSEEQQRLELERRAEGREQRYAWDFDPEMEIFAAEPDGTLTRLTTAQGYDAEGSYSPDGKSIVFSSTRDVYGRERTDAERKQLEIDPSFFAEIWIMDADGANPRRLTRTPGYDGGPFFTADGERIVWRRFDEQGLVADIWTMKSDGSDPHQLTDFGSMSWAPYPHPSGRYVIFTSNKLGFTNFELFIVDMDGLKEPVRVTFTDGFDGLPVPSPDGAGLSWTSTRQTEQGQIFMARWNHERALEALENAPPRGATAP